MSHSQPGRQVCEERLIFCVLKEPHLTAGAELNKMLTLHTHTPHTHIPHTPHTHKGQFTPKKEEREIQSAL